MKYSKYILGGVLLLLLITLACSNSGVQHAVVIPQKTMEVKAIVKPHHPSVAFKKYWYAGEAEISSYTLEQARYGQLRSGNAVLIYVTEDFLPKIQVKADQSDAKNIPVLKLNTTKSFLTGIYPYSIMQSTFYPIVDTKHAIKVSSSMQEWCGHVYAQLNNRKEFEMISHSYFQGEADQEFTLTKVTLENELWNKIRIRPETLPIGTLDIIPSLEFCRLKHKEIKAYTATALLKQSTASSSYELTYPTLKRTLKINFTTAFPHEILGWEETFNSGFGVHAQQLTTKATLKKQMKSPYWNKNSNKDVVLRDALGL